MGVNRIFSGLCQLLVSQGLRRTFAVSSVATLGAPGPAREGGMRFEMAEESGLEGCESNRALAQVLLCVAILAATGFTSQGARAVPPDEREAREILRVPKGTVSLGQTNGGELVGAEKLPPRGRGYALIPGFEARKTNFGTTELIEAIEEATAAVEEKHPKSLLGVGNMGFEDGRKIPWSVSHQAGRDADLGMYAVTEDGKRLEDVLKGPLPFHAFDASLEARVRGRIVRFDVGRNLSLVSALVSAPGSRVQYIFVAKWLKEALLAEGRRSGLSASALGRLAEVLHQPSDSNPHADHFHIRLFCTIEDRTFGCLERGPSRAWVDPGDKAHAEAARKVASILEMQGKGSEKLVLQAIARLERMMATQEVDALIGALEDSRAKVRKAALGAIVGIGDSKAADGIVALLPKIRDAAWAMALFSAVPKLDADALVLLAERVLKAPAELLHPDVRRKGEAVLLVSAIAILAAHGDKEHVPTLIAAAGNRDGKVKKAAIDALKARTCQPLTTAKAFEVFWGKEGGRDEGEVIAVGLEARGIRFARGVRSLDGVGRLIGLLDHRDKDVRTCAERLLERMTGHESGASRSPARNRKHWAYWWSENKDASALK